MSDERVLLDNLHGRINAVLALCTAIVAAHEKSSAIMSLFEKDLKNMQHDDATPKNDNYYLGLKFVHDHLVGAVQELKQDLALLSAETTREH